eukprot:TRINITY_DN10636_c0_g1_i2.p1 TRINITY_DN10636_c0_g1~~TRINITY_DN10636_c0_g1_i2.p1  ORF type:complete len:471 (-),score=64.33 TRINITY_DN10636_c0_g1_i2:44-1456(-)
MTVDVNPHVFHLDPGIPEPNPLFLKDSKLKGKHIPRVMQPIDVVIVVENSGRWPSDMEQYIATKMSLATQFAEQLETSHGLEVRITGDRIDVFLDGFVFRLYIRTNKDGLFGQEDKEKDGKMQEEEEISQVQLPIGDREMQCKIAHNGLMGFLTGEHPSFAGAVRLLKLWTQTNLLGNAIEGGALELIVGAAYTSKAPRAAPGSPLAGFQCALQLLGNFRWEEERMVVDPQKKMEGGDAAELAQGARKQDDPAMCVCTAYAPQGDFWTSVRPTYDVLPRITLLARNTLQRFHSIFQHPHTLVTLKASLLYPPYIFQDYDVLLHLRQEALPWGQLLSTNQQAPEIKSDKHARIVLSGFTQAAVLKVRKEKLKESIVVGFNPLEYFLQYLQEKYGHLGIFSGNTLMGDVIAIKWNAKSFIGEELNMEKSEWQGSKPLLCEPHQQYVCVISVLQDIQQSMAGLLRRIEFVQAN